MTAGLLRQALLLAAIAGVIVLVACGGEDQDDTKRKPEVDCKARPELCT